MRHSYRRIWYLWRLVVRTECRTGDVGVVAVVGVLRGWLVQVGNKMAGVFGQVVVACM